MNLVANNSPLSTDTLNEALDLATSAVDAVRVVQTGFRTHRHLSSVPVQHRAIISRSPKHWAVIAVTTQLSTYQAQLTASYAAIAKVQSLNLASYLH
jgi:flagellar hook-associated protein 3 FlgL